MYRNAQFTTRIITLAVSVCLLATFMLTTYQARAATTPLLKVGCAITVVAGHVEVEAPFVRIQIYSVDNLSQPLVSRVVRVNRYGSYAALLTYTPQKSNSRLAISVGEWDGDSYLLPATIQGRNC